MSNSYIYLCLQDYSPPKFLSGLVSNFYEEYQQNKNVVYTSVKNCKPCSFKSMNYSGNSSPRDLIITVGFGKLQNIYGFVKSVRNTGCKATILFASDLDPPSGILDCGVTYIKTPKVPECNKRIIRWQFFSDIFNILDPKDFDRVYYSDLFDSVFQGDPFTSEFTENSLLLSDEGGLIKEIGYYNPINWVGHHGLDFGSYGEFENICSGTFGCGYKIAKLLFNTVANWFPHFSIHYPFRDQQLFNILIHSEPFMNFNFDVKSYAQGGNLSSVFYYERYYSHNVPVIYKDGRWPVVAHHLYRLGNALINLNTYCDAPEEFRKIVFNK